MLPTRRRLQLDPRLLGYDFPALDRFEVLILAMRHPRRHVLAGCLSSLVVMTILSAAVGMAAPNLDADIKLNGGTTKSNNKADDDLKKKNRPFLTQFFSPIFLKIERLNKVIDELVKKKMKRKKG
ncbi:hypothetical protein QVD17_39103 [Tagetes erecta]|uniref:Uncharacterized protein n=1 Tax=Tagetes erecta TaxID=13708 RepID=A0AAD8JRP7_TARER|nr:hypothetical protein QVD17_39103 [Tagetes erecta]